MLKESHSQLKGDSEDTGMTFFDHLKELRLTLIWCISSFVVAAVGSLCFYKQIANFLRYPLDEAINTSTSIQGAPSPILMTMKFMDVFSALIYIGLIGGILLSTPIILFKLGQFIAPALTESEQKKIIPFSITACVLFIGGILLSFFWIAPLSIRLVYFLSAEMGMQVNWLAADYYGFIVLLSLFVGILFEFPLVILFLIYTEIVSSKTLLKNWRWVITGILICEVVVSPIGDPIALIGLAAILFTLFLLAIYIGDKLLKKKKANIEKEESENDSTNTDGFHILNK